MKKITLLLVIIFTFLFSNTSWGEWSFSSENVNETKFYYDKDRVRKSGKSIYFWMLHDHKKSTRGELSSIIYTELDCSIFRFKGLKYQSFDKSMGEGEIIVDMTPPDEWNYPKPNSTFEYMFKNICEKHEE